MARLNRRSIGRPAISRPVLTGNSHADWAFWQLASVLAEIAEDTVRSKNDGGVSTQRRMPLETGNAQVVPLVKGAVDV